jgi:hypothetical protein
VVSLGAGKDLPCIDLRFLVGGKYEECVGLFSRIDIPSRGSDPDLRKALRKADCASFRNLLKTDDQKQ